MFKGGVHVNAKVKQKSVHYMLIHLLAFQKQRQLYNHACRNSCCWILQSIHDARLGTVTLKVLNLLQQ